MSDREIHLKTQAEIERAHNEGRVLFRSFNKNLTVNTTAGFAQDLSGLPGNPVAQYFAGASGESTLMSYLLNDKGLDHGPSIAGYRKFVHIVDLMTVTAALAPSTLRLCDYLMFYPFIGLDEGLMELTNSRSYTRYEAREGVQIALIEQNPYAGGATVRLGYTNQDGVPGRLTPVVQFNSNLVGGAIATSNPTLAGAGGDFMPLQSGDYGVQRVDTIEFFVGDVGTVCVCLVKPLVSLPIYETTAPCQYDLWNHFGMLPEIRNDAYLNFILKPSAAGTGAATNTIHGNLTTIWEAR